MELIYRELAIAEIFTDVVSATATESKSLCEKFRIELDKNPVMITELTLSKCEYGAI